MLESLRSFLRLGSGLSNFGFSDADYAYGFYSRHSGLGAGHSVSDHRCAYYRAKLGVTSGSLNDLYRSWLVSRDLSGAGLSIDDLLTRFVGVATNLAINPSFESVTAGTTTVRTNLLGNPRVTRNTAWVVNPGTGGVATRTWYESGGHENAPFVTATWTTSPTGGNRRIVADDTVLLKEGAVVPDVPYTASVWVLTSVERQMFINVDWSNAGYLSLVSSTAVVVPAGVWTRLFVSGLSNAQATKATVFATLMTSPLPGESISATKGLLEQTTQLRPYFDGATPDALGFDYGWTGAVDASTSTAKAAVVEVRRNLAANPQAATLLPAVGTLGWSERWFGNGGAGTHSFVSAATDGPALQISKYVRKSWTVAGATGDSGYGHGSGGLNGFPAVAGDVLTFSSFLRATGTEKRAYPRIIWYDVAGVMIGTTINGNFITLAPGAWGQVVLTATAPPGTAFVHVISDIVQFGTNWAVGDTLDGTALVVEKSPVLGTYFDGGTTSADDFLNSWTGAVDASASVQSGVSVATRTAVNVPANIVSSLVRARTGARSVQIINKAVSGAGTTLFYPAPEYITVAGNALKPDTSYVWSIHVYVPAGTSPVFLQVINEGANPTTFTGATSTKTNEWELLTVSFSTTPVGGAYLRLRAAATTVAGSSLWVDSELLIKSDEYTGEYFDGDSPFRSWTGTPHASISTGPTL